jgi:hypothetical protein
MAQGLRRRCLVYIDLRIQGNFIRNGIAAEQAACCGSWRAIHAKKARRERLSAYYDTAVNSTE